ncbi:MAG: PqqD family protein [Mariprofundaceae bacterium]|nr:PqqD family protein [Mariprofundaceae bacterium]
MNELSWQKEHNKTDLFPKMEALQQLALNDSGFVFDPVNGRSFTANSIGLFLLKTLQKGADLDALLTIVVDEFDVDMRTAERDITEFAGQLRKLLA